MPSSSVQQRNYVFYLRNKYKSKDKAPEKYKWAFEKGWETIEESSFRSEIKAWITPDGEYLPFLRIKNHDDMLPLGLRYGDALRKGWIRVYKTPDTLHITCHNFDGKKLKCCASIFGSQSELMNMPIVVADGSKVINYKPLFKEQEEFMNRYKSFFEAEEDSLSDLTDDTIPEKIVDFIVKNPFPKDHTQIHSFAGGLGIEPDILEQYIYAFLTVMLTGGKSKGEFISKDEEQLAWGEKIESEHVDLEVDNKVVNKIQTLLKNKIANDHLREDSKYYSAELFQKEMKKESK